MAREGQRRRKKHRGTQAGTVRHRGRTSRAPSRLETGGTARQRRADRLNRPPTWRAAFNRAILSSAVFLTVLVLLLKQSAATSISLALFMFVVYIPMGYAIDAFVYRMRQRRKEREQGG
jgi:hypothetical protein